MTHLAQKCLIAVITVFVGFMIFFSKAILEALLNRLIVGFVPEYLLIASLIPTGIGLATIGPICMRRENAKRLSQGRKIRYCVVEYGVIIVMGLVFTVAGIAFVMTKIR